MVDKEKIEYYIYPEDICVKFANDDRRYPIIQIRIHGFNDSDTIFEPMLAIECNDYRIKDLNNWTVKFAMNSNVDMRCTFDCKFNNDILSELLINKYSYIKYSAHMFLKDKNTIYKYVKTIICGLSTDALKPCAIYKDIVFTIKSVDKYMVLHAAHCKIKSPLYYYFANSDDVYDAISVATLFYILFLKYSYKIFYANSNLQSIYDEFRKLCPDYKLFDK